MCVARFRFATSIFARTHDSLLSLVGVNLIVDANTHHDSSFIWEKDSSARAIAIGLHLAV
jgi:hypothetical protein